MDARKAYGLAVYKNEGQIKKVDDAHYLVQSQSDIFPLEHSVERLHMSILLWNISPDKLVSYSQCLH